MSVLTQTLIKVILLLLPTLDVAPCVTMLAVSCALECFLGEQLCLLQLALIKVQVG